MLVLCGRPISLRIVGIAAIVVGLVAAAAAEKEYTYRDAETDLQALARFAARVDRDPNEKITIEWVPGALTQHWGFYEQAKRGKRHFDRAQIPAERIAYQLTPQERQHFIRGLSSDFALRQFTDTDSDAEILGEGSSALSIAVIEIHDGKRQLRSLRVDQLGLPQGGGAGRKIYSPYLAELLDSLTLEHCGIRLPPDIKSTISGEKFLERSRSEYALDASPANRPVSP